MEEPDFNEFILANMPYFIAVNYQRLLEAQSPQEQVKLILHIYNLSLRVLTINLVSQYVFRDRDRVSDSYFDKLLEQKFPHLTPDAWEELLFTALRSYEGNQDLFFMPELYDFYWDTSTEPHRRRDEVTAPFDRLTQATVEVLQKQLVPQDESGWQTLAEELREHLDHILQSLSFICKYDLIHVLDNDDYSYTFDLHKGTHISKDHRLLFKPTKLIPGCFYLRTETEDFLRLDPWLVYWDGSLEGNELLSTDTGVFDRLVYERLRYLLTTPDQMRMDDKHVGEFIHQILDAIEEHRSRRIEAEKLTWVQLCDICEGISKQRMATVQGKYHKGLYLQRNKVHQQIEAFLADPGKRGFVLVGKSGVGKSNFLFALAEELQSRSNVCMLMYDAANLPVSSYSLSEIISRDFSERVFLSRQPVQHVWQEMARIDGIDERQVVFCVDAINENPEAKELLRQLDGLVQGAWSWLKVVFSSRPETWKEIRRGVKLAEALYYRGQGGDQLGVELERFSYSEQMGPILRQELLQVSSKYQDEFEYSDQMNPFTQQELPEVYSKYQQEFQLQTPYEALSHEVREILRDPLNLWLLASTHRGQAMPDSVKTSELIEQYVKTRLQWEDLRFLEKQLLPLMVQEDSYSNVITASDLDAAGGALYEMVYSDQVLSNRRRVNESFLRLGDAEILVQQQQGLEQRIVFKYERFYEYFAGKRIVQLSASQSNRSRFFGEMIEATSTTPFLWGAVRNALVQEAKERGPELLLKLCFTEQQRVKEMLVNVLVYLGQDDPLLVETLLRSLVPEEKKASEVQKIRQVVRKPAEITDLRTRNARKIAIEVASSLKLGWVLQAAALQTDPEMRAVAVRYSYYLWQRDRAAGFEILEYIAEKATTGLVPNFTSVESVFGLSVIIFCDHYQDEGVLSRLQGIWRAMIAKLFRVHEGSSPWKGVVRGFIRERIIVFAITVVFGLFRQLPSSYSMVSYPALESFFQLETDKKALYRNLVHYLDVDGQYSREQMEHDYLAVLKIDNVLVSLTTLMGLVAHACSAPIAFLPFLKQLFEEAKRDVVTYPYLTVIANVAMNVLYRDPLNDEMFDFFVYTAGICQEYYAKHPEMYHSRVADATQTAAMAPYILFQYRRTGTVRTTWFETRIQAALSQHNFKFFELMLTSELPQVGIERQEPRAALAALEVFSKSGDVEINQLIQAFLSRLRVYYPDEVDDFLEEQQAPDAFRLQVRTNESVERVGDLIGIRPWFFLRDDILLGSLELRSQLQLLFEKAADCKNTQAWMESNIRLLVNVIYGSQILRQSE